MVIKNKVPFENFKDIKSKFVSYVLGFIWADGFIRKPYTIQLQVNMKDSENLKLIFNETGYWNYYVTNRFDKRINKKYKSFIIHTSNKNIVNFLLENDYDKKSYVSPSKILHKIPKKYISYFYRGYSDGDGNFYKGKNTYQYTIAGHYDQNWDFMESLYNKLNINYTTKQVDNGKSKSSFIRIVNKNDIDIFGDYIYNEWDNVGLNRKYNKYMEISKDDITRVVKWSNDDIKFLKENYKMNHTELAKIMKRTKYSIDIKCSRLGLHKNNSQIIKNQ